MIAPYPLDSTSSRSRRFVIATTVANVINDARSATFFVIFAISTVTYLAANALSQTLTFGPLSHHMVQHILLMNVAAPLAAYIVIRRAGVDIGKSHRSLGGLGVITACQLLLLWAWHSPSLLSAANNSAPLTVVMHVSLFVVACLFWHGILIVRDVHRWRSILALLITAKLFCLLGALLVFAPRGLYALAQHSHTAGHPMDPATLLEDQQLAGLMMVAACPLTYVLAGVVIAAWWLRDLEKQETYRSISIELS